MPPALSKRMPDGIRLFIAGRSLPVFPELFQRPGSKHEREREKENTPPPFTPQHPPPLRSYGMPYFKQPPDSDGDFRPDLKKVFSGMGRAREGKGQFLQKTPLPLSSFPRSTAPPQIRTTRKAGGLLWPCKGLLPAAPKDAGFHAVQAQCPCRLGYPLKGS